MWSDDDAMSHDALNAAWTLIVELRTGIPEIQLAASEGDIRKINRCLDALVSKARRHGLHVRRQWPRLAEQVRAVAESLRSDVNDQKAWQALMELADELEAVIAVGSGWPTSAQWDT